MSITSIRSAFTLIELILVITIIGIVAALAGNRLSTLSQHSTVLTPLTLKNYLSALHSNKRLDLVCYEKGSRCDLWEGDKKIRTALTLESASPLTVFAFNRYGRLIATDPAIYSHKNEMGEGSFLFSLYPDGTSTPLILQSDEEFIAYTPLADSPISGNEDEIRTTLYDTALLNAGSYYGNR